MPCRKYLKNFSPISIKYLIIVHSKLNNGWCCVNLMCLVGLYEMEFYSTVFVKKKMKVLREKDKGSIKWTQCLKSL